MTGADLREALGIGRFPLSSTLAHERANGRRFDLTQRGPQARVRLTEDEGSRQQSADERRADRIAAALSDGPQTRAELADLLGVGPAAVSKAAAWEREHERRFASDGCTHVAAHYSLTDA